MVELRVKPAEGPRSYWLKMVGPLGPVFKGKGEATSTRSLPGWSRPSAPERCGAAATGDRTHERRFVMSKFMLTVALMLGAVSLVGGSARADYRWYGPYNSQAQADAVGQGEIDNNGAGSWGAGYQPDDPTGGTGGAGYYVVVQYPDQPTAGAQPNPGGLLGVPFPGDPGDPGDSDPDDGMGP